LFVYQKYSVVVAAVVAVAWTFETVAGFVAYFEVSLDSVCPSVPAEIADLEEETQSSDVEDVKILAEEAAEASLSALGPACCFGSSTSAGPVPVEPVPELELAD
jgi:hypothetical protein